MKQKVIVIVMAIAIVITIAIVSTLIGTKEHIEKQGYEQYLSLQVANDISKLYSSVSNNERIYNEILNSKTISLKQAERLYKNNYLIVSVTQEYQKLATQLKLVEGDKLNNQNASNASSIAYFFERLIWDIAEQEGIDAENRTFQLPYQLPALETYNLENETLRKIEKVKQLNDLWVKSFDENIKGIPGSNAYFDKYKETGITSEYWVGVIEKMELQTQYYLEENDYLDNIKSILY